ncbi:hypothetical protein QR98_0062910 [Sarcoptes scabiei]|uniref:Uncharacterized protein n=1 Tax=Sarcoptes scabiei TaxID=52283 RepID=A0A132AA47_SARSC|nr:hypothetical protein QR98_0062910 [Sarcoptes scabiei]
MEKKKEKKQRIKGAEIKSVDGDDDERDEDLRGVSKSFCFKIDVNVVGDCKRRDTEEDKEGGGGGGGFRG